MSYEKLPEPIANEMLSQLSYSPEFYHYSINSRTGKEDCSKIVKRDY